MNKKAYQTYQRVNVTTADPTRLVVLLYEGAIRNLRQAIGFIEAGNKDDASQRITRTLDIVHYLTNALDHEKGGDISVNLERLYDFVRDTLAHANIHADVEEINTAITILQPLLEGWQGICRASTNDTNADENGDGPPKVSNLSMMG